MTQRRRVLPLLSCAVVSLCAAAVHPARGQQTATLSDRIDQAITSAHLGNLAVEANDFEFLRRVYLNLIGRSPSVEELRAFTQNPAADKRVTTIDQLLASPEFDDYFTNVLDIMFMERRGGTRVPQEEWRAFLHRALSEKWPFDRIVQTIIAADGSGELRGASKFLLEREVEPNALTRDIGRILLGRDLQCAQCHDHPNIMDYEQSEYYGIYAFVQRSYLFEDQADNNKSYVGEKADGVTEFKSVFLPDDDASQMMPRLLGGLTLDAEPRFEGVDAYLVPPSKTVAGIPKFSRRAQLARLLTHPSNKHFAKNAVNRFWAHMTGRGFVEPVDFHHPDNLPTHPELLNLLADEFISMGFDMRRLLREIANSSTYQRSIEFPSVASLSETRLLAQIGELTSAIETLTSTMDPPELMAARDQLSARRGKLARCDQRITDAAKRLEQLEQEHQRLAEAQANLQQSINARQKQLELLQQAAAAAKQVAESFKNDEGLSKQHAEYQQRVDQLSKEVASTKTKITEQESNLKSLVDTIATQQLDLGKLRAQRIGVADMVAEARGAVLAVQAKQRSQRVRRFEKQQQLAALSLYQTYLAELETQNDLHQLCVQLADATEANQAEKNKLSTTIAVLRDEMTEDQQQLDQLSELVAAEGQRINTHQTAIDALDEAIRQATVAAKQFADSKLDESIATLQQKRASLGEQRNEANSTALQTREALETAKARLAEHEARYAEVVRKQEVLAEHDQRLAAARAERDAALAATELARQRLRSSWERRFAVRALVPLSPEQLASSTISALELKPRFQLEAEAEWQSKHKDQPPEEIDDATKAAEIAALVQQRVDQIVSTYVSLFAPPGGAPQDVFSATADQALFLANDGRVQNWFNVAPGSLMKRLQTLRDAGEVADELYLAILSRPATESERQQIQTYLAQREGDLNKGRREVAWSLLSSLEFRFNR